MNIGNDGVVTTPEPTSGLDQETMLDIFRMFKKANEDGISMVIVFKPDAVRDNAGITLADVIASNSKDPKVIAALLGNASPDDQ